jgi:MOSC domain-containing protein YiiM
MPRLFAKSGRSGFYLAIKKGGQLSAGDGIHFSNGDLTGETIEMMFNRKMNLDG